MGSEKTVAEWLQEVESLQSQVRRLQSDLAFARCPLDEEREVTIRLLGILSSSSDRHTLLQEVTALLHQWSGCEAVGVRLRRGQDYPYFETRGFPAEFVEAENSLCGEELKGTGGGVEARPMVWDCLCGMVLSGHSEPSLPFFSDQGSFWTNDASEVLASPIVANLCVRPRYRCLKEGYRSLALLPLRSGDTIHGLLQLNDTQPGQFSPEKIAMLERLAGNVAIALAHRQAEEELRASEQRYRTIVEQQSELVIHFRSVHELAFANPAFCHFFATTPEIVTREGLRPLVVADDWPKTQEYLRALMAGRAEDHWEHRMIRSDGAIRWIAWFTQTFRDHQGNVVAFQATGRDVTALKCAEQTLRESEARFRRIFDDSPLGMAVVEPVRLQFLQVNPRLCEILDYPPQELLTLTLPAITHPAEQPLDLRKLQELREGQRASYTVEKRYRRRNGQECWARVTCSVLADKKGAPELLLGMIEDISEQRRAEEALRDSEQFVGEILACAGEGIVVHDRQLCYRLWNPFMEQLTGMSASETLGRYAPDVFPHLRANGTEQLLRRVLQGEVVQSAEAPFHVPQSGKSGWTISRYTPRVGQDGQISGVVGVIHDATGRKHAEEKLQRMQAQLAHSGRLATMGELLAGIAHEINQPLYSIVNYANACGNLLAQQQPDLALLRQWTAETRRAAERAGEIIRRLREFARRSNTGHTSVRVAELLDESIELVAFETRTRGICVERPPLTELPNVHVDRVQIQQVLVNLLRNASEAVEAIPAEKRQVTVNALATGDRVQISVSDNGPGIPPESEPWIFDPFFTTKKDGLGLGLAISKTIVQAHGGELQVTANPGGGVTFHFLLSVEGGRRCAKN